jgi:hypothetical protein
MAKWWWTISGALAGATLAFLAMIFVFYLERSDFGTKEPVYGGYWSIAALGVLMFLSPPGALVGGIVGYLFGRRRAAREKPPGGGPDLFPGHDCLSTSRPPTDSCHLVRGPGMGA